MSNKETEVIDGASGFFNKLADAADIVTTKLVEVAPEAAEAMLNLIQIKGVFDISKSAFLTVIFLGLAYKLWKGQFRSDVKHDRGEEDEYICVFAGVIIIVSLVIGTMCAVDIFIFYNWVAIFYPEGALALRALEAVGIPL